MCFLSVSFLVGSSHISVRLFDVQVEGGAGPLIWGGRRGTILFSDPAEQDRSGKTKHFGTGGSLSLETVAQFLSALILVFGSLADQVVGLGWGGRGGHCRGISFLVGGFFLCLCTVEKLLN